MDDAKARWEAAPDPLTFGRLRVRRISELLATASRGYILKGILSPAEMSLWVGAPKCGKSFLMLHIGFAIAQQRQVFGRRVKAVPVLYVAAEGEAGIAARLRALQDRYSPGGQFYLIAQPANLLQDEVDLQSLIQAALRTRAGLLIIDTLSRVLAGGDENGPQDMGKFIANIGELREKTGAHVAIVHHGTKASNGTTSRGHSSLVGAADAVIEVTKEVDGSRTATVAMAKDDPDGAAMGFRLKVLELGTDPDGDPIATCVVEEMDTPARSNGHHLTPKESDARKILADLIASEGAPLPTSSSHPIGLYGVPEGRWRDMCDSRRLSTAETAKDRGRVFRAAYAGLKRKGIVGIADGIVWLTCPKDVSP